MTYSYPQHLGKGFVPRSVDEIRADGRDPLVVSFSHQPPKSAKIVDTNDGNAPQHKCAGCGQLFRAWFHADGPPGRIRCSGCAEQVP